MRSLLAILAGVIAANVVFFIVASGANLLYPTPPELMDPQTPEETTARVDAADAVGLLLVVLGGALGGLAGGVAGAIIAGRKNWRPVAAIAGLLSLWGVYSLWVFYPDRLWFPIGLLLAFPLFSCLGGFAGSAIARKRPPPSG